MSFYYVRSTTGSDSNNGASWATAKQTITGALNAATSGDTVYVSQAHNYYVAANIAYPSSKGTASAPILVVCVNDAQEPPTQLATTAIENNTATASTLGFPIGSHYHWYGITFKSAGHLYLPRTCPQRFENCTLQLTGTTSGVWHLNTGQSYGYANTQFVNTTFTAAFAGSYFYIYNGYGWGSNGWPHSFNFSFKGCTFTGTPLTYLFKWEPYSAYYLPSNIILDGCDLSNQGTGCNIFGPFTYSAPGTMLILRNCKLNANVNLMAGPVLRPQHATLLLENCDHSGTNSRYEWYGYQGHTKVNTTVARTGGASDGSKVFSYVMNSNLNANILFPLASPSISTWCNTAGAPRTATIAFAHDSASMLGSNDIWAEITYVGTSTAPLGSTVSSKIATYPLIAGNPTTPPADTNAAWIGNLTTPNYQKFQLQFTPMMQGQITVKVYLARPNYTVYVDPMITLT
jgi:hypothetical protein